MAYAYKHIHKPFVNLPLPFSFRLSTLRLYPYPPLTPELSSCAGAVDAKKRTPGTGTGTGTEREKHRRWRRPRSVRVNPLRRPKMAAAAISERVELAKLCSSRDWSKAIRVLDSLLSQSCSIQDIWSVHTHTRAHTLPRSLIQFNYPSNFFNSKPCWCSIFLNRNFDVNVGVSATELSVTANWSCTSTWWRTAIGRFSSTLLSSKLTSSKVFLRSLSLSAEIWMIRVISWKWNLNYTNLNSSLITDIPFYDAGIVSHRGTVQLLVWIWI